MSEKRVNVTAELVIGGKDVSKIPGYRLYLYKRDFLRMYSEWTDICNDGLIAKVNEVHEALHAGEPFDEVEYNHFISEFFAIAARAVNRSHKDWSIDLRIVPDTATCYGKVRGHHVGFYIDWNTMQLEGGEAA